MTGSDLHHPPSGRVEPQRGEGKESLTGEGRSVKERIRYGPGLKGNAWKPFDPSKSESIFDVDPRMTDPHNLGSLVVEFRSWLKGPSRFATLQWIATNRNLPDHRLMAVSVKNTAGGPIEKISPALRGEITREE